jgi:hypothetical protein
MLKVSIPRHASHIVTEVLCMPRLTVRLSDIELDQVETLAAQRHCTLSDVIRDALARAMIPPLKPHSLRECVDRALLDFFKVDPEKIDEYAHRIEVSKREILAYVLRARRERTSRPLA